MSTIKEEVILGALLHDIGKFYQRTGLQAHGYEHFTPEDYGRNGAHAKWSAAFIEEYLPTQWRGAAALALYHHVPRERQSPEQQIISDADALSAGIDREKRVGDGRGDPRRDLQISLLQAIFLPPDTQTPRPAKPREYCYPLRSLSLDRHTIFPTSFPTQDRSSEYHQLWNNFVGEIKRMPPSIPLLPIWKPCSHFYTNIPGQCLAPAMSITQTSLSLTIRGRQRPLPHVYTKRTRNNVFS